MHQIALLPRFGEQIRLHLVANYMHLPVRPVLLGIFGKPGDGKSAQLSSALEQYHVQILRVNAADLESGLAGEPGKLVARTYKTASVAIEKGTPTAIVVDDIDTTVGEWELNTGTVNHQQVLAEFMHIADRPVDASQQYVRRVPIFVTGNNLQAIYPPLRRHGRMRAFEWGPTPVEVRQVVNFLFAETASESALEALVREFPDEPLAFYAEVRNSIVEGWLSEQILQMHADMRVILKTSRPLSGPFNLPRRGVLSEPAVIAEALAVRARRSGALRNFLSQPTRG